MAWSLRKPAPDSYASVSSRRDASDSGVRVTVRPQSVAPVDEVDPFGTTRIFELQRAELEQEDEVTMLDIVLRDPPTEPHLAVADPFELVARPVDRPAAVAFRDERESTLCSAGVAPVERVSEVPASTQAATVRLPRRRGWFASFASWLRGLFVTRTAA